MITSGGFLIPFLFFVQYKCFLCLAILHLGLVMLICAGTYHGCELCIPTPTVSKTTGVSIQRGKKSHSQIGIEI